MVVASSIGADLAMAFLTQTKLPVEHAFFDGGHFGSIGGNYDAFYENMR